MISLSLLTAASVYLIWGITIHLIVDWLFQNDWMAVNKTSLEHPAAWVHSGLHLLGMLLVFPWWAALMVFVTHLLIDTRKPLLWWGNRIRQTKPLISEYQGQPSPRSEVLHNIVALTVSFWRDQVAHVLVIAVVSLILAAR